MPVTEAFPLQWPTGWKRTNYRKDAGFGTRRTVTTEGGSNWTQRDKLTINQAIQRVQDSLRRMYVSKVIISTNLQLRNDGLPRSGQSQPGDPGAAVYWDRKGKQQCMAIDRYSKVADNLAAIAATLEYLRGIERHGGGEILDRAFTGFAALPSGIITQRPWRDVFGTQAEGITKDEIKYLYRELAKQRHPDKLNGSHIEMAELNAAYEAALLEVA